MDERQRRKIEEHLHALLAYLEAGGEADLDIDPPLWLGNEGPVTISVLGIDRERLVNVLPRGF